MEGEVSVGAIGAGDYLRLGPSVDTSSEIRHELCVFILL